MTRRNGRGKDESSLIAPAQIRASGSTAQRARGIFDWRYGFPTGMDTSKHRYLGLLSPGRNAAWFICRAGKIAERCGDSIYMLSPQSPPLGLAGESTYPEATWQQQENEQITLLTDGVVEARAESGELFGFDRTGAVAGQSAEAIAGAAKEFGQDDDITVLTLTRVAVAPARLLRGVMLYCRHRLLRDSAVSRMLLPGYASV